MTVRGKVNNIRPWTGTFSQVTLERPPEIGKISDHAIVYFLFRDHTKIDRLKVLKRGDDITVTGQILELTAN